MVLVGRDLKPIQFQPSAMGRVPTHQIRLPTAPSSLAIIASRNLEAQFTPWYVYILFPMIPLHVASHNLIIKLIIELMIHFCNIVNNAAS